VAPYAAFFRGLGKTVATIFDQQQPADFAAIKAASHFTFQQPFSGFEELVVAEMSTSAQARFVRQLEADGEWPPSIAARLPASGAPDSAYPPALFELLKHKKGDEYVPELFGQAGLAELPATVLTTLAALRTHTAPPPAEASNARRLSHRWSVVISASSCRRRGSFGVCRRGLGRSRAGFAVSPGARQWRRRQPQVPVLR
jgi:hypothetical protein